MSEVSTPHEQDGSGPYADAALRYHSAGWAPLPLPARAKKPVPTGWTGRDGAWPSGADVWAWTEDHPEGNLALRLAPDVIGIDVDHYDAKPGGLVLSQLEDTHGALPLTWRSTSRDDGTSGIRLYRVPAGLRWPSVLGPGIEVIRHEHRYTLAWPSVHPDTGGTYRWITPDGATALDAIPTPDDLPHLPDSWVHHFTGGEEATDQPTAGLDTAGSTTWLSDRGQGAPCKRITDALTRATGDLTGAAAGSRHDAALSATNRLVWLAGEGHPGANVALAQLGATFLAAANDRRHGEAEAEWDRMIHGAVDLAAAAHTEQHPDPCTDPFAGLIPKDTTWTAPNPTPADSGTKSTTDRATASSTEDSLTTSCGATSSAEAATERPAPSPASTPPADATSASVPASSATTTETSPATPAADTTDPEPERTSWWPRNLDATLNGEDVESPPEFLQRGDGHGCWYRGRVNGIIGPSESGKTWVALHGLVQAVRAGRRVTILDFEDTETGVIGRLLNLGLTVKQINEHVAYIGPDEPFHPYLPSGRDLHEHLDQWCPDVLLLDGFNAAMTIQGLELMSNRDATSFFQTILNPLADRGIAVVYIDHTPKDKANESNGGIGAQAKRGMTKGCTLRVDVIKPFGKGQEGRLRIIVDKDRQGMVRGISAPSKTGHWAGDVVIGSGPDDAVSIAFDAPEGFDPARPAEQVAFRPTGYMAKVSTWLERHPDAGRNEVIEGVHGNDKHIGTALRQLVEEGWVSVTKGARNKSLHTVDTPFDELLTPPLNDWGPTGGRPGVEPPVRTTGGSGGHDPDVVRSYPAPSQQVDDPTATTEGRGPQSKATIERTIAGERVHIDLDTGEIVR